MTSTDILYNSESILEGAKAFRKDANDIMSGLAKEFKFDINSDDTFPFEMYKHKANDKGVFNEDWTYYFHGSECRFDNLRSGQIIELISISKPEFGYLDGFYFYNYLSTTDRFKDLALWFGDYSKVWKALEVLADNKVLRRDLSVSFNRNIIAK